MLGLNDEEAPNVYPKREDIDLAKIAHLSYGKRYMLEIVEEIARASGKNEKTEILRKAVEASPERWRTALHLTYHPRVRFYIRKIPDYRPAQASAYGVEQVMAQLAPLWKREVTGNKAIEYLTKVLEAADPMDAEFVKLVILRDLRCGISTGTIEKVLPGLIPDYPVMLCTSYDKALVEQFGYPAYIQPKKDGMRVNVHYDKVSDSIEIYLRNGRQIETIPHQISTDIRAMAQVVGRSFVIDGEFLVTDPATGTELSRKDGNGILNRLIAETIPDDQLARITVCAWDFIDGDAFWTGKWDVGYQTRFSALQKVVEKSGAKSISLIQNEIVLNYTQAAAFYQLQLSLGAEGAVLKSPIGFWANARPKYQLKMKVEDTEEYRITGGYEGKGRLKGKLGGFLGESLDGTVEFRVGSGFSDEQRSAYWPDVPVGKLMTVQSNGQIQGSGIGAKKSLYLPVFIEVRADL